MQKLLLLLYFIYFITAIPATAGSDGMLPYPRADTCILAPPVLHAERTTSCSGQPVLLWSSGCAGTVKWSNGLEGDTIVSYPALTRTYTAYCQEDTCKSTNSAGLLVEITIPQPPIVNADKQTVCAGESVVLSAIGCAGTLLWSNGMSGTEIEVRPAQTTRYTAICQEEASSCISCFAEDIEIKVRSPLQPVLTSSRTDLCSGDSLTLRVSHCPGTVSWSDGATGSTRLVRPVASVSYEAFCQTEACAAATNLLSIQVGVPSAPLVRASQTRLCAGGSTLLTAAGCSGTVVWSNGMRGDSLVVQPEGTLSLSARCERDSCTSVSSPPVELTVAPPIPAPVVTDRTNTCPYTTLDLMTAVQSPLHSAGGRLVFRTASSSDAPEVLHPGIAGAGTYYVTEQSPEGCSSTPAPIQIHIAACANPIAVCTYYPATARLAVDSTQLPGQILLTAHVEGLVTQGTWSGSGTGAFTRPDQLQTTYMPSEADRQSGRVTITFVTSDPDTSGPCQAATATAVLYLRQHVEAPAVPAGTASTGQQVLAPVAGLAPGSEPDELFIPEAFSPNGDGINDRFVIRNVPKAGRVSLEVYNRWGQLVYANSDYKNDWEGTSETGIRLGSGKKELSDGTYFYVVRLSTGNEYVRFFSLVR